MRKLLPILFTFGLLVALFLPASADDVYLPLVAGGGSPGTAQDTVVDDVVIDPPVDFSPGPEFLDALPECTDAMIEALNKKPVRAPEQKAELYVCRAVVIDRIRSAIPMEALDPNYAPVEGVQAAAVNAWPTRFAYNYMSCPTCTNAQGVIDISYAISTRSTWLNYGYSWNSYHWQNKAVAGKPVLIPCEAGVNSYPVAGAGVGLGNMNGTVYNQKVIWYNQYDWNCFIQVTNINVGLMPALYFDVWRVGANLWSARVWINGGWVVVFNSMITQFDNATYWNAGQGVFAQYSDFGSIHNNMQFYHQFNFVQGTTRYPWFNTNMPSHLQNKSANSFAAQFYVPDAEYGEYTGLAARLP